MTNGFPQSALLHDPFELDWHHAALQRAAATSARLTGRVALWTLTPES
jgi:hypothetical protein